MVTCDQAPGLQNRVDRASVGTRRDTPHDHHRLQQRQGRQTSEQRLQVTQSLQNHVELPCFVALHSKLRSEKETFEHFRVCFFPEAVIK
jgi:hypothetical protein